MPTLKPWQRRKKGAEGSDLKILGVTVLTSMNDADLNQAGYRMNASDLVPMRAKQARDHGAYGVVASAHEVSAIRAEVGPELRIATPGIRPAGSDIGDQKRVMTPGEAVRNGVDHLIIARPITQAPDPKAAVDAILNEIREAL